MIRPVVSLLLGGAAILFLAYASLATRAVAQSTPQACQTVSDIEAEVESQGSVIVGAATYKGAQTDSLLVVETKDVIALYGFKDGCYIGAMLVESAAQRTGA